MAEIKRTFKDSVFTCLFSEPKYTRELYLYLHPEDQDVTEEECRLITTENILAAGMYNDLGIQVRNRLIILMEAQSTLCPNMPLRILIYLALTYKGYVVEHELPLYSERLLTIPRPELYMVYTGTQTGVPEIMRLSDLWGGESGDAEITVKVLRGGDDSILGQYVDFCRIADEQRQVYGLTRKAIQETMRICQERNVLVPFLAVRRKEVVDIMELLFSEEEIRKMVQWDQEARQREALQEARQEGRQEERTMRDSFYYELLNKLKPLGRVNDLLEAMGNQGRLEALAREFGLSV